MSIAILSDIHDHLSNLRRALAAVEESEALICCGDLCSPFVAKELAEGFAGPVHIVFGNNDGDRWRLGMNAQRHPHLHFHGEYAELEFGGRSFAVQHFDSPGRALARGGTFDVVCFGHNHRFEITREGSTLIINPGEVFGGLTGQATCALYDPATHEARRVNLG
jgi:putative phosphoesterase